MILHHSFSQSPRKKGSANAEPLIENCKISRDGSSLQNHLLGLGEISRLQPIEVDAAWEAGVPCGSVVVRGLPLIHERREFNQLTICVAVLIVTSITLKLNWWNKLEESYGSRAAEVKALVGETDIKLASQKP